MTVVLRSDFDAAVADFLEPIAVRAVDHMSEQGVAAVAHVLRSSEPAGRLYPDPRTGGTRRASAPGQPPADPYHALEESWKVRPARRENDRVTGSAYSESGLSPTLEFGDERVAPRPHARPALAEAAEMIPGTLRQALR